MLSETGVLILQDNKKIVNSLGAEPFIFLGLILSGIAFLSYHMGAANMFKTMMATAHDLLLNTVFFIMGVAVLAGAFGALLSEFGVIAVINRLLSPLMKPLYGLPGASVIGVITTYLSDNPAIISLANDKGFKRYFKKYQIPALTNLGTAYGMGLIVTTVMISNAGKGESFAAAAVIGNIGAVIGSIVSVRIMLIFTKKRYGADEWAEQNVPEKTADIMKFREIRNGSVIRRGLEALLEGGKSGVEIGLAIIPGVLIICTFVMMITNGPQDLSLGYRGLAYEGVQVLPAIGQALSFVLKPVFGFSSPEAIAFPITSLGSVGAALGLVPKFLAQKLIGENEIAVFTAIGMCWSGYLSTHVAMMDALGSRELTGKAILSHTIGGLAAGIAAHFIYLAYIFIL